MQWVETDTSENGDRWELMNSLGIMCRLAVDPECYRLRIAGDVTTIARNVSLDEAKSRGKREMRRRLALAIIENENDEPI